MPEFKNRLLIFILLFICISQVNAQEGALIVGGGATYEVANSSAGINGRFYYGLSEPFCFGPEISFFPYQEINKEYESSIIDLNFNAHYIFEVNHKIGVYPLSGLNYTIERERLIDNNNTEIEEKKIGLNYGIGSHYSIGKSFVFLEFKGIIGKLNDEFITLGVIFNLQKENE